MEKHQSDPIKKSGLRHIDWKWVFAEREISKMAEPEYRTDLRAKKKLSLADVADAVHIQFGTFQTRHPMV